MKILCGFKYELYVDDALRSALSRSAGCRRFVFNKALALQNERKQAGKKLLTYNEMAAELVLWKKADETAFLKEAMSQALQQVLRDLDRAIKDSFRPKGDPARKEWPKFKAKDVGDGFRSSRPRTLTTPTAGSGFRRSAGFAIARRAPLLFGMRTAR